MEEDLVDKQEPFFSVVMPSYNRSTFIKESISSVLAQEFLDFELIFVDDGSVDDTKQLVEDIIKLDSRVRYFFQENKERGAARNTGIKRSLGKYVLFFDSDDFMLPTYLSTLHKWIVHLNHPNLIAAKYNIQRANKHYPSSVTTMSAGWYDINLLVKGTPFGCLICFKNAFPDLVLHEESRKLSPLEDWLFLLENIRDNRIYLIDKVEVLVNDHSNRSMNNNYLKVISARLFAAQIIADKNILEAKQLTTMWAYSFYFCAIHAYLGNDRKACFRYLQKAFSYGLNIRLISILLLKSLIGRRILFKLKNED